MEVRGVGGRRQISAYIKSNILNSSINDIDMQHEQNFILENEIKDAVEKINEYLKEEQTHIEYEKYEGFKNQFIIKIVDSVTKKTIKEIPPRKILDMVAEICRLAGVIVDRKA
ncbi:MULTISPECIES: flagellar protein FlaG [Clostridium]|uniref:flagellar protein FlaG n=1 Tax=Clostridium TaxID=1485 RepID=UPI0004D706D7|nr:MULTISPECIES: flagellar protein FlaG [Clostridium]KEH88695.1 flagellin [Clostridium novyi A str. 4540]KEH94318.1 flagellin [Clostridium botulinum C/D str. It1]KEH95015.1 flagellin [Clostridium novyi A str. GD211209]